MGAVNGIQFLWKCSTFEQTLWPLLLFLRKQLLPFDVALRFFLSLENHRGAQHPLVGITLGWNFSDCDTQVQGLYKRKLASLLYKLFRLTAPRVGSEAGHGAGSEK